MKTAHRILHEIKLEENSHALTASNYALTDDAIVKAMHEFANQWISVEDELPKIGNYPDFPYSSEMILLSDGNTIYFGEYESSEEFGNSFIDVDGNEFHNITHWKPLPTPPNKPL